MKNEHKHPDYYQGGGIEVFDIIDQFVGGDFYLGNALKYICRAGKKSKETKIEDLNKAAHYIEEAIRRRMMKIKIVRRAGTLLPEYKTAGAACMDLEASIQATVEIMPWETLIIGTGIFVEIPEGWCIEVVARSSLHKSGRRLPIS